jgi:acetyl-CoA carboxylase biotin carboxyl carrier protein
VTLTAADVAEIMRLVEQSSFDHLSLEMDGVKLSLSRAGARPPSGAARVAAANEVSADARSADARSADASDARAQGAVAQGVHAPADPNSREITAPMLGTFYRSPKPGAPPFVEVGSVVAEDTIIAIIEVMKLMNTVRAGVKGVITDIVPADETLVEFGSVLMRARRDD